MRESRQSISSQSSDLASAPEVKGSSVQTILMAHISHDIVTRIHEINEFVQGISVDPNDITATSSLAHMKRNLLEMKRCVFRLNTKFQVSTFKKEQEEIYEIIEKEIPNKEDTYLLKKEEYEAPVSLEHVSQLLIEKMGDSNAYEKAYNAAVSLFQLFNLLRKRLLEVGQAQLKDISAVRVTKRKDSIQWTVIPELIVTAKRNNFAELDQWAQTVTEKFFHDEVRVEEKNITEQQVYDAIKAIVEDESIIKTIGILEFKKIIDDKSRDVGFSRNKLQLLVNSAKESRDRGTLFMSKWGRVPATQSLYEAIASIEPHKLSVMTPAKLAIITDYKSKVSKKIVAAEVKAEPVSDSSRSAELKQPLLNHAPKKSKSAVAKSYLKTAALGLVVGVAVGAFIFVGWPALAAAPVVFGGSVLACALGFPSLRAIGSKIIDKIVDWVHGEEVEPVTDLSVRQSIDEENAIMDVPRLSQGQAFIQDRLGIETDISQKASETPVQQTSKTPEDTSSYGLFNQPAKPMSSRKKESEHVFGAGFTRF